MRVLRLLRGCRRVAPPLIQNHPARHDHAANERHQQENSRHCEHRQYDLDTDVLTGLRLPREIDDDRLLREEEYMGQLRKFSL